MFEGHDYRGVDDRARRGVAHYHARIARRGRGLFDQRHPLIGNEDPGVEDDVAGVSCEGSPAYISPRQHHCAQAPARDLPRQLSVLHTIQSLLDRPKHGLASTLIALL